jgi:hypothetical protein
MIFKKRDNFENEKEQQESQQPQESQQEPQEVQEQPKQIQQVAETTQEESKKQLTVSEIIQKEMDIEEKKRILTNEFINFQNEIDKTIREEQDVDRKNFLREQKKQMLQKYRTEMSLLK